MVTWHGGTDGATGSPEPVALATARWGRGPGRALLLHGVGSAGATWWRLADALAEDDHEVVAPDLRGHGSSPRAGSYLLADHVADVRALGTGWDLVVGHSLGGLLGALASDAEEIAQATHPPSARAVQAEHPAWDRRDAVAVAAAAKAVDADAVAHTLRDNAPWRHTDVVTRLVVPTLVLARTPPTVRCSGLAPASTS